MDGLLISKTMVLGGIAVGGATLLTGCACWIAPRLGFVDRPDGHRKLHQGATPLLGGVAVMVALLLTVLGANFWCGLNLLDPAGDQFVAWVLATACAFCLIGVVDDRWPLRPRTKFLLQVLACLPFAIWGRSAAEIDFLGLEVGLGNWSVPFTILWLVACVNAFNLADGMDGQATSLGIVSCLAFAGLAVFRGDIHTALLALLVVGNLLGFLWYNRPPARIFLGDAGSLTIGFLAGSLALETSLSPDGEFAIVLPCVALAVPLFDTCMAIVRRKLKGRGIGEADREHIHHSLQDKGFSRVQSLLIVVACGLVLSGSVLAAAATHYEPLAVTGLVLTLGTLLACRLFGHRELALVTTRLRELFTRGKSFRLPPNPLEWLAF
ncbi:MAG: MraY family glycosyltransferase [Planctomycetota bacterium]